MLDLEIILTEPEKLQRMLLHRNWDDTLDIAQLQKWITQKKQFTSNIQAEQAKRNAASKTIGELLSQKKTKEAEESKAAVKEISATIAAWEEKQEALNEQLDRVLMTLPNWLDEKVPFGGENASVPLHKWGTKPKFDFATKTHYELGEKSGVLNFERGVKLAGARFYTYWDDLARLERALLSFMLDLHRKEFAYREVFVPMLINDNAMYTTGQFPKFRGEYYTLERDSLSLIPTAEVPLVNLFQDEIIQASDLPIALVAASSCFRREAGAAGKDTRGLVRVHQFQKVELVQLAHPEKSEEVHTAMLKHAETVLQRLELPYQVILKAAGDTGATAFKSYDIEVWMPGLNRWLEISSVSNCRDYQARRGKIRFKEKGKGAKVQFVHTLNGSGVAAGRCMIAIMENYQQADGTFRIPAPLQKYLD